VNTPPHNSGSKRCSNDLMLRMQCDFSFFQWDIALKHLLAIQCSTNWLPD